MAPDTAHPKSAAQPRRPARGFTLIELLVAVAIMSLLALLCWRALDGMTRTQAITQERADNLLRLQATLGQWGADLDAIQETDELDALHFDGRTLRLTRRDSAESGLDSPGIRVVAWSRANDGRWVRWQSPPIRQRDELARAWQRAAEWGQNGALATGQATSGDSVLPLIGITQWQLFYHRGETWSNPLSAAGSESTGSSSGTDTSGTASGSGSRAALPNGVRLVLSLPAGTPLSGNLVRDWIRPTLEAGR